mgnify:CR=1 FL=1
MCDFAVSIDVGLLVNPANALQVANIKRILRAQIARVGSLNLTAGQSDDNRTRYGAGGFVRFTGPRATIDLKLAESHESLVRHADLGKPLVIGLSLSTKARLPELIRLVLALRIVTPSAIVGVAPALDMSDDDILQLVDADIIFRHAGRALADLERRLHA